MGLTKVLEDFQMIKGETLNDKMVHADIINNNLVLTIDFDNPRIAALQFLQLKGVDWAKTPADAMKALVDMTVFPPMKH